MSNGRFLGWYYKQRARRLMLAFIPGRASGGPFVQMIDSNGTRTLPCRIFTSGATRYAPAGASSPPAGLHIQLPLV